MSRFPDGKEIYEYMRGELSELLPSLTDGTVINGILRVVAAGISMLSNALKWTYWNIFPHTADRDGIRRWFEVWGMDWNDAVDTETARKQVLSAFRHRGVGTAGWYRRVILDNFGNWVDRVDVRSWAGVVEIILSRGGKGVSDGVVSEVKAFLELEDMKVAGVEVVVKTVKEEENEVEFPIQSAF